MDKDGIDNWSNAIMALLVLTCSRDQGRGTFLEHELLSALTDLCKSATEVQWTDDFKALFNSAMDRVDSSTTKRNGIVLTLQEVEIWCKFMDQIIYRGQNTTHLAIRNYQKIWFAWEGAHHLLDFQYDPNKAYTTSERWMYQDLQMMTGSQVEFYAKSDYFFTVATMERLEKHAKCKQDIKLDHDEMGAIFQVLKRWVSADSGFLLRESLSNRSMGLIYRRIYSSFLNMMGASFAAQEVVKLCAIGGVLPRPKPIPHPISSKTDQSPQIPPDRNAHQSKESCDDTPKMKVLQNLDSNSVPEPTGLIVVCPEEGVIDIAFDIFSQFSECKSMELPHKYAMPLLVLCQVVFENTAASPVDARHDPAHPQVTALKKLAVARDNKHSIKLDTEETRYLSKFFGFLPLKHLGRLGPSIAVTKSDAVDSRPVSREKAPNIANTTLPQSPGVSESVPKDNSADLLDEQVMITIEKEVVDRIRSICETKFPEALLKFSNSFEIVGGGVALKAYVDIIDDGINSMRAEQEKTLEQLVLMRKKVQETEAKTHDIGSKAAEDLRSERGAYTTLKKNLSNKVEELEKDLERAEKNLQKSETKITKRAERHSKYVQKLQGQLKTSDTTYKRETTSKKMSDEHNAKLLGQEQELAKLRSSRTNPKIEKDNIERAARDATHHMRIEVVKAHAELEKKQAEVHEMQAELDQKTAELKDAWEYVTDDQPSLKEKDDIIKSLEEQLAKAQLDMDTTLLADHARDVQVSQLAVELAEERRKSVSLKDALHRVSSLLDSIRSATTEASDIACDAAYGW
ncbi:hypothetical protein BKA64DRAFT_775780 [Cadophora sp. MPI-SDFR-AT-0126]|nr:hypothetical protein BKA64DRAFT_775780 [Leotiomycetes sp. MPI-SDFR-AT-0126]